MANSEFQIAITPIEKGVTFLEASAGTGKTYTISKTVVRLIAEKDLPVSSILVMTFTEAATKELKGRIRQAIQETLIAILNQDLTDDLAKHYLANSNGLDRIVKRLRSALAMFDEAAIYTIHGFCHRVLNEFAFEGNHLFEPTLVKEQGPLWRECLQDFWRSNHYEGDPFLSPILDSQNQSPATLLNFSLKISRYPDIEPLPEVSDQLYWKSVKELKNLWASLGEIHAKDQTPILELISNSYLFKKQLSDKLPDISGCLEKRWPTEPTLSLLKALSEITQTRLQQQFLKKHEGTPLNTSFFESCEGWEHKMSHFIHQHSFFCLRWCDESLDTKKKLDNLLTFDDLLPKILNTLESVAGSRLQSRIQSTYYAALVDEFQDTDPQQTELFKRLFISPNHYLFFIGDPKQAIYKFRGADIFSYLQARELANEQYTLSKNWRSDPRLIEAVNELFNRCTDPFLFNSIQFLPSTPALDGGNLTSNGDSLEQPLKLCFHPSTNDKPISAVTARKTITQALTQEILRLLSGSYQLNDRTIEPADIAILTRSNSEAREVREELTGFNLPSVLYSELTVFETEEAGLIQHLLNILLEPSRLDWIRALYVEGWFGWTAEKIRDLNESSSGWSEIQEKMHEFHLLWFSDGITSAMDAWMHWSELKTQLLARPGGERSVTNLLHLAELLSSAELELQLSALPLFQWLNNNIEEPDKERDDFITRLENDDQAIQIVTIHKSKGLQYPIVFVPFAWGSVLDRRKEDLIYHREANDGKLVYDKKTNPDPEDTKQFQKETLSDAVRLLYVALTRAQNICYLFWGEYSSQNGSSIGHLFGLSAFSNAESAPTPSQAIGRVEKETISGIEFLDVNSMTEETGPDFIRFSKSLELSARSITRPVDRGFNISSFSSLASGFMEAIDESKVEDEEDTIIAEDHQEGDSIFSLPKGTVTGNLLHDILECTDFGDEACIRQVTQELTDESAFEQKWIKVIQDHLIRMIATPLSNSCDLTLNKLRPSDCLKETEFHFPTSNTPIRKLLSYFKSIAQKRFKTSLPELDSWNHQQLNGYLRGFIDLTFQWEDRFYILDWKSNWLGDSVDDYFDDSLNHAITHHAYFLQYYLYTLALYRYLKVRYPKFDYDLQFGGVYYLFVRGIDPEHPGSGVFFDRPDQTQILELDKLFKST